MKSAIIFSLGLFSVVSNAQEIKNLGPNVNTEENTECYPAIEPKGKTLYFSRNSDEETGYEIMFSKKQKDGTWGKAEPIPELNNKHKNVVYDISKNGKTLLIFGTYGDSPKNEGLSTTTFKKGKWSSPEPVRFDHHDDIEWGNNAASFSNDGKTMIITIDGDLCVSKKIVNKDKSVIWSSPIKLPKNINTKSNEYTPFLSPDDQTLYFCSNGHGGLGSYDIFKVTRKGKSWTEWSDPINLGEPINSDGFESFYEIDKKGEYAILYSLEVGDGDLLSIDLKK